MPASTFTPTADDLFFKSSKTGDPRLGDITKPCNELSATKDSFILVGYPDDEGIKLNLGRVGASEAPDRVRKYLYKTTPNVFSSKLPILKDGGNLNTSPPLAERHNNAKSAATQAMKNNNQWIAIGGGHDYGYPDAAGFLEANKSSKKRPVVINFDAHLDVRPTDKGLSSGTPFFRLLEDYKDFDFFEVGIQSQCNSKSHFDWAKQKGAKILTHEEISLSGKSFTTSVMDFLSEALIAQRPCFISIDIDGFSSAYAMGCSQSWATGIIPNEFFPLFETLIKRWDVQGLGIYEVSPKLDLDDRTSKLAAQIIHRFVQPCL